MYLFGVRFKRKREKDNVSYNVMFRRPAILREGVPFETSRPTTFQTRAPDQHDEMMPIEFKHTTRTLMKDTFSQLVEKLESNMQKMQQQYD